MAFKNVKEDWKKFIANEFEQPYFIELSQFLKEEYAAFDVLPPKKQLFTAFEACALKDIKVVILGQDPYPTPGHAHGLCFSVLPDVFPLPKSLNNVYKEIRSDLSIDTPENGYLMRWAEQGVFLLNTVLTVRKGEPQSHANKGWENFTDRVIEQINQLPTPVVFLLWGSRAQTKKIMIDTSRHLVLEAPHPSPLSAHRGFFGCKHFSKTNDYLVQSNLSPIEW